MKEYWYCIVGPVDGDKLPPAADSPPRRAVDDAVARLTGGMPVRIFSGWGVTEAGKDAMMKVRTLGTAFEGPPTVTLTEIEALALYNLIDQLTGHSAASVFSWDAKTDLLADPTIRAAAKLYLTAGKPDDVPESCGGAVKAPPSCGGPHVEATS